MLIEGQMYELYNSHFLRGGLSTSLLRSTWGNWIGFCYHLILCVLHFSCCLYCAYLYYRRLYVHYFHLLSTFPDYLWECSCMEVSIETENLRIKTGVELYRILPLDISVQITNHLFGPIKSHKKASERLPLRT